MSLAPIALFGYKRPEHLTRTLKALQTSPLARASELHVFSDGPKQSEDRSAVEQVRTLVRNIKGFAQVLVHERVGNLGLAQSVIEGVTELSRAYGRVIVLEDDLVVAPGFLTFMNQALQRYQDEPKVMQVSGYMFPVAHPERVGSTFLCRVPTSWGWGTWERAWKSLDLDSAKLLGLLQDEGQQYEFNVKGAYPYFEHLKLQAEGKMDVWGVRWYASMFVAGGLCVYPGQSMVQNIGMDGSGVHCGVSQSFDVHLSNHDAWRFPDRIEESALALDSIREFLVGLRGERKKNAFMRVASRVSAAVNRLKRAAMSSAV
jgi:hypothetical protein